MASTTIPATSRSDLLAGVEHGYVASRAVVDALPQERFAEQLPPGWTLKDVVAHMAAWEETVPARVERVLLGDGLDPTHDDIDGFNRRVVEETREASVPDVLARWAAAHAKVVEVVRSFEGRDVPKRATDIVEWNTTGHYPDHYADLGAAIKTGTELARIASESEVPFRLAVMSLGLAGLDATTPSGWTYKDLVAHVGAWADLTRERLARYRESGEMSSSGGTADEINADIVARTRGRDAREVLKDLDASTDRLFEEIAKLDPTQLHANEDWASALVAGNTYGHFAEHHVELFDAVPKRPAELVELMREGWRMFRRPLARLGLMPLSQTTPAGWTYKAMLAHLAYWMEVLPEELPARLEGRRKSGPEFEDENAREAAASAARSAHSTIERLDAAFKSVLDITSALPADRDLHFMAVRLIAGETYGHFLEHLPEIEAALPRTVAGVLARYDTTWKPFRAAIRERGRSGLGEATPTGWRYRDVVAHSAGWLERSARELRSGEFVTWNKESILAANEGVVRAHELVGPEALLDELDTTQRRAREEIARLTDERLADPKVFGVVAFYTYLHWEEHFGELGIHV